MQYNTIGIGFYNGSDRGLITTADALKTSQAQKLLKSNKEKNAKIKKDIENEISTLEILDNEKIIQEELKAEKVKNIIEENNNIKETNIEEKNILVFITIGLAIIICIVILIIEYKKKKRIRGI